MTDSASASAAPCPACAEPVPRGRFKCPHCGERLRTVDAAGRSRPRAAGCLGPLLAFLGAVPTALGAVLLAFEGLRPMRREPELAMFLAVGLLLLVGGSVLARRYGDPSRPTPGTGGLSLRNAEGVVAATFAGLALCSCLLFKAVDDRNYSGGPAAIGALKTIATAQTLFREGDKEADGNLDYGSLAELASAGTTGLVDSVLGSGTKQGYTFQATYSKTTSEFLWFAVADPAVPGTTGDRYFAVNHEGVTFYSTAAPFRLNDTDCQMPFGVHPVGK